MSPSNGATHFSVLLFTTNCVKRNGRHTPYTARLITQLSSVETRTTNTATYSPVTITTRTDARTCALCDPAYVNQPLCVSTSAAGSVSDEV